MICDITQNALLFPVTQHALRRPVCHSVSDRAWGENCVMLVGMLLVGYSQLTQQEVKDLENNKLPYILTYRLQFFHQNIRKKPGVRPIRPRYL